MHARQVDLERHPHYACGTCEDIREGEVIYEQGYNINRIYHDLPAPELLTVTEFDSRDYELRLAICPYDGDHRETAEDDDDAEIIQLDEAWECGECGSVYQDRDNAADCCM